jgi:hypothetical protein
MIEYKGFEVSHEDCFWPTSFGYKYKFTNDGFINSEKTIQDVKDNIDDRTCDFHWHPLTQTGFELYHDLKFWEKRIEEQLDYIKYNSPFVREEVIRSAQNILEYCQIQLRKRIYESGL